VYYLGCADIMASEFQAFPIIIAGDDITDRDINGDEVRVHRTVMERWMRDFPDTGAMLVRITNPITEVSRICCLGGPHIGNKEYAYVPVWILENIGISVCDDNQWVTIEPFCEEIPQGTMIYLKPMDNAIYHCDMRECFERALDTFHVLEAGTILTVAVESLGGYTVQAYVDRVEPGPIVRLGGEINVEFIEPDGGVLEFAPPVVPVAIPVVPVVPANVVAIPVIAAAIPAAIPASFDEVRATVRASWLKKFEKDKG